MSVKGSYMVYSGFVGILLPALLFVLDLPVYLSPPLTIACVCWLPLKAKRSIYSGMQKDYICLLSVQ